MWRSVGPAGSRRDAETRGRSPGSPPRKADHRDRRKRRPTTDAEAPRSRRHTPRRTRRRSRHLPTAGTRRSNSCSSRTAALPWRTRMPCPHAWPSQTHKVGFSWSPSQAEFPASGPEMSAQVRTPATPLRFSAHHDRPELLSGPKPGCAALIGKAGANLCHGPDSRVPGEEFVMDGPGLESRILALVGACAADRAEAGQQQTQRPASECASRVREEGHRDAAAVAVTGAPGARTRRSLS